MNQRPKHLARRKDIQLGPIRSGRVTPYIPKHAASESRMSS
jgi:hypothetical protein